MGRDLKAPRTPVDAFELLREKARRTGTPLSVHMDLTHRCNVNCVHCYIGPRDYPELSTARIRALMDELAGMGTLFLTFSGGEIFLRTDLFALLDYARVKRFSVKLITNATMIDEPAVKLLRLYPIYQVGVSVYSLDPVVHDAMTAQPGSLAKTRRAVEMLARSGMNVMVKTLVTRLNAATYPALARWADALGPNVQRQFDLLVTPRNDGIFGPAGLNLDGRARAAFIRAAQKDRKGKPEARRVEELEPAPRTRKPSEMPCFAGQTGAYIGPSGVVYPCIDWHLPCGSVADSTFAEIWRGSPQLALARAFNIGKMKACASCELLAKCSLCPGINQQERGDPAKPADLVCARTRAFASATAPVREPARKPARKPKARKKR